LEWQYRLATDTRGHIGSNDRHADILGVHPNGLSGGIVFCHAIDPN